MNSFYKDSLPDVIEKLKEMIFNNLEIVSKNINPSLQDDKMKNALASRRIAVEDAIWAAKEVDGFERELSGIDTHDFDTSKSYFVSIIPFIIKELKGMVENNLEIIDKEIDAGKITDDKLKNALASRKLAAEDVVWAAKEVDRLEHVMNGTTEEKSIDKGNTNWTKRIASNR